jgi:hypothetical protein
VLDGREGSSVKLELRRQQGNRASPSSVAAQLRHISTAAFRSLAVGCVALGLGVASDVLFGAQQPPGGAPAAEPPKDDPKKSDPAAAKKTEDNTPKSLREMGIPPDKEPWKGTRPKRDPVESLTISKPIPVPDPKAEDRRKFDELRKKSDFKQEDMELLDRMTRYQVFSLTRLDGPWKNNRDDIEKTLDNEGFGTEKFRREYKALLEKYLVQLLDNHLWTRVNAMKLLAKLEDEGNIDLFVKQIRDPQQHEAVKLWAIKGIGQLGQRGISQVDLEARAVAALLDTLTTNGELQSFTRQTIVQSLGSVGRPMRTAIKKDCEVAIELMKIMRNPANRRWDRHEAMIALAQLQIPNDIDYNFQLVAHEIGQFVADAAAAALRDPAIDDLRTHLFLVFAYESLLGKQRQNQVNKTSVIYFLADKAKRHQIAKSKGDEDYVRTVGGLVHKLAGTSLIVYKINPKPEDLDARVNQIRAELKALGFDQQINELNSLLQSKPPRAAKLTPEAPDLGPPPQVAGPAKPADKPAEPPKASDPPAANGTAPPAGN